MQLFLFFFFFWVSQVVLVVKNQPANAGDIRDIGFDLWVGKIPWSRAWQPTPVCLSEESPWTEEPGRLQSIGLQRVRHDRSDLAHTHTRMIRICLVLQETAKAFSKLAVPFCIPTSNEWKFPIALHLTNVWYIILPILTVLIDFAILIRFLLF